MKLLPAPVLRDRITECAVNLHALHRAGQSGTGSARSSVVIGHPHRLYLDGLVRLLDDVDAVQLAGSANTEDQLVDCVRRERPEVVIFEPFAPYPHGLAVLSRLRAASDATKALVILRTTDPTQLMTALQSGAWGYFSYDTTSEDIVRAINVTRRGELWVRRGIMQQLLQSGARTETVPAERRTAARTGVGARCELSEREQEVAAQVVAGLCNKRIATSLRIAESTVKAHLVSIFRKLAIQNRTQLARRLDELARAQHGDPDRRTRLAESHRDLIRLARQ